MPTAAGFDRAQWDYDNQMPEDFEFEEEFEPDPDDLRDARRDREWFREEF